MIGFVFVIIGRHIYNYVSLQSLVAGKPVFNESGELVITKPFPSMPVFFWNDENGEKYQKAYFKKNPGMIDSQEHQTLISLDLVRKLLWVGTNGTNYQPPTTP